MDTMFHAAQLMTLDRESPLLNPGSVLDQCHRVVGHAVKYCANISKADVGSLKSFLGHHPMVMDPVIRQIIYARIGFVNLDRLLGVGVMVPPPVLSTVLEANNPQVVSGAVPKVWATACGLPVVGPKKGSVVPSSVPPVDRDVLVEESLVRPRGHTNEELIRDLAELEYMAENKRLHAAVQASRLKSLALPTGSPVPVFTVQSVEVEPFNADVDSAFPAVGEWKYFLCYFYTNF
jgi:hypothetical protein